MKVNCYAYRHRGNDLFLNRKIRGDTGEVISCGRYRFRETGICNLIVIVGNLLFSDNDLYNVLVFHEKDNLPTFLIFCEDGAVKNS